MLPFVDATPRVLVKHYEPIVAMGLLSALGRLAGFDVVADDPALDAAMCVDCPQVIVCDYDASLQMAARAGTCAIVALARKPREFEIQEAIERGVLGYVVTGCSLVELESAVRAAAQGRRFLCQAAAQEVANGFTAEALTARERDVLVRLAQGHCNKAIANRLDIAVGTVKAHVRSIMSKLKASSRTEAASLAAARGMLPEPSAQPASVH